MNTYEYEYINIWLNIMHIKLQEKNAKNIIDKLITDTNKKQNWRIALHAYCAENAISACEPNYRGGTVSN